MGSLASPTLVGAVGSDKTIMTACNREMTSKPLSGTYPSGSSQEAGGAEVKSLPPVALLPNRELGSDPPPCLALNCVTPLMSVPQVTAGSLGAGFHTA